MAASGSIPRGAKGPLRVVVERVRPQIDGGRYPIKRTAGETVTVEADVFCDGHDVVAAQVEHRSEGARAWTVVRMEALENDRWRASFPVYDLGRHRYRIRGWVDRFATWRRDLLKKVDAGQDVSVDLLVGAELVEAEAKRRRGAGAKRLKELGARLRSERETAVEAVLDDEVLELMHGPPHVSRVTVSDTELPIWVDPPRARFSTWYELFPRSAAPEPGRHGTFDDVIAQLPAIADMGFDVLYLPPIHPIGFTNRKGPNNDPGGGDDAVGSPWAIGSAEGGHDAIHPDLGTFEDFDRLVAAARERGIEIALDIAFQCSPDHPWVQKHPEWFRHRPDGSIQFAENPPKRYEDIYPLDFESPAWHELWLELRDVVEGWIARGVRVFRVDNPHTKPFGFWEWMIGDIHERHPDVIFLSEAFTRPAVMNRLAKLGFTQSYTYFTWRNLKWEIERYFTELTQTEVAEYFRPNLWPNTPDILTAQLQHGGRPTFVARLVLAATLGASYGIYGPAFELMEHTPVAPGREEYLDSEKYQLRAWDLERPDSLRPLIATINRIRHEHPALQTDRTLRFCGVGSDDLVAYLKTASGGGDAILTVVNLDPFGTHSGMVSVPVWDLGFDPSRPYEAHDLLTGARYTWHGEHNYVELDPHHLPAHVLHLTQGSGDAPLERFQ